MLDIPSIPFRSNIYGDPNSPSVPKYIWPNNCNPNPCRNVDEAKLFLPQQPDHAGQHRHQLVGRRLQSGVCR